MIEILEILPPQLLTIIAVVLTTSFVILLCLVIWAAISGREVSLWPPSIGAKASSTLGTPNPQESPSANEIPNTVLDARPIAHIYVRDSKDSGRSYIISSNQRNISAGRSADNDIVLVDNVVSRIHFRILINPLSEKDASNALYSFTLLDAGSPNGTYVDETRVSEATLSGTSHIRAGGAELDFHILNKHDA